MQLFAAICWLLRCYCLHRVCAAPGAIPQVLTRQRLYACIRALACCASQLVSIALSAGCSEYCLCMHAQVCACMPTQPGTACSICLMGPAHQHRHHIYARSLCNSGCTVGPVCCHLLVLCCSGCTGVCATCCKTTRYSLHGMSDHQHTRKIMHIYSTLFWQLNRALQLFASYPDYCCMHRVCACRGIRLQPARSFRPTEHI
jgi:hypothetical protein